MRIVLQQWHIIILQNNGVDTNGGLLGFSFTLVFTRAYAFKTVLDFQNKINQDFLIAIN